MSAFIFDFASILHEIVWQRAQSLLLGLVDFDSGLEDGATKSTHHVLGDRRCLSAAFKTNGIRQDCARRACALAHHRHTCVGVIVAAALCFFFLL